MRQLLATSGGHVIVGLNHRVLAFIQVDGCTDNFWAVELQQDSSISNETLEGKETDNCDENPDDENEDRNDKLEGSEKADNNHKFSIQAVSCFHQDKNVVLCAVSRCDKTISVYKINVSVMQSKSEKSVQIQPDLVYKSPKRCSALTFAQLKENTLLLGGDMCGDIIAYSTDNVQKRQLLLGHTASAITSIKVATLDNNQQVILSADRDEKVRISHFPACFVIDGFLLGHTAFVSSIDVSQGTKKCITCSGDGSVILWDFTTHQRLSLPLHFEDSNLVKQSETGKNSKYPNIHTNVAIHPSGKLAIALRNLCQKIEVFDTAGDKLLQKDAIDCRSTVLYASFGVFSGQDSLLIYTNQSPFLRHYEVSENFNLKDVSEISPLSRAVHEAVAQTSQGKDDIPNSIIELDEWGNLMLNKSKENPNQQPKKPVWNTFERKKRDMEKEREKRKRKLRNRS